MQCDRQRVVDASRNQVLGSRAEEVAKVEPSLVLIALVQHEQGKAGAACITNLISQSVPSVAKEGLFVEVQQHVRWPCVL